MSKPIILSWSGGKDSMMTLHFLKEFNSNIRLLTTVSSDFDRVSIHGVRKTLFQKQIKSLGLEVDLVEIPYPCPNEMYEEKMAKQIDVYKKMDVEEIAFGDLFLIDVRKYREEKLAGTGIQPVFPVWGSPTDEFIVQFLKLGYKTIVTCVDTEQLDQSFCGRIIDEDFLNDLPEGVDPCGENGEFHTFVFDGPLLKEPVDFEIGEGVLREDRFYFVDLLDKK